MHTYIHTHIHTYIHTHIHMHTHTHIPVWQDITLDLSLPWERACAHSLFKHVRSRELRRLLAAHSNEHTQFVTKESSTRQLDPFTAQRHDTTDGEHTVHAPANIDAPNSTESHSGLNSGQKADSGMYSRDECDRATVSDAGKNARKRRVYFPGKIM